MTTTKALAGGVAANVIIIALWLLELIPGWETVPMAPKAAIIELVIAGIGYGLVYVAPPNRLLSLPSTVAETQS